jgi:hypothetical protein
MKRSRCSASKVQTNCLRPSLSSPTTGPNPGMAGHARRLPRSATDPGAGPSRHQRICDRGRWRARDRRLRGVGRDHKGCRMAGSAACLSIVLIPPPGRVGQAATRITDVQIAELEESIELIREHPTDNDLKARENRRADGTPTPHRAGPSDLQTKIRHRRNRDRAPQRSDRAPPIQPTMTRSRRQRTPVAAMVVNLRRLHGRAALQRA